MRIVPQTPFKVHLVGLFQINTDYEFKNHILFKLRTRCWKSESQSIKFLILILTRRLPSRGYSKLFCMNSLIFRSVIKNKIDFAIISYSCFAQYADHHEYLSSPCVVSHFRMEINFTTAPGTETSISFNYSSSLRPAARGNRDSASTLFDWIKNGFGNPRSDNANIYIPNLNTSDDMKGLNELIKNFLSDPFGILSVQPFPTMFTLYINTLSDIIA